MRFHLRYLATAALAAGLAGPAAAAAIVSSLTAGLGVSVGARVNNHVAADEWTTSDDATIYGNASASTLGANADVAPGATWPSPCTDPSCGDLITNQVSRGQGEVNGNLGRLRTHAHAHVAETNSAAARGEARIEDIVRFGFGPTGPQLKLHIDGRGLGDNRGYALMDFTVFLGRHACDTQVFPDGCFGPTFTFHAQDYEGSNLDSWFYGLGDGSSQRVEGSHLPEGGLDIVVDLLEFGARPGWDIDYDLVTTLSTYAECPAWTEGQSHGACSSHFDASNTVYVGITGLDSSTYRYPGIGATDPGGSVPAPASLPLVLTAIGAAAVGTVRPRRARRS